MRTQTFLLFYDTILSNPSCNALHRPSLRRLNEVDVSLLIWLCRLLLVFETQIEIVVIGVVFLEVFLLLGTHFSHVDLILRVRDPVLLQSDTTDYKSASAVTNRVPEDVDGGRVGPGLGVGERGGGEVPTQREQHTF